MREGGQSHAQATMHPVWHDIDMSSMGMQKLDEPQGTCASVCHHKPTCTSTTSPP